MKIPLYGTDITSVLLLVDFVLEQGLEILAFPCNQVCGFYAKEEVVFLGHLQMLLWSYLFQDPFNIEAHVLLSSVSRTVRLTLVTIPPSGFSLQVPGNWPVISLLLPAPTKLPANPKPRLSISHATPFLVNFTPCMVTIWFLEPQLLLSAHHPGLLSCTFCSNALACLTATCLFRLRRFVLTGGNKIQKAFTCCPPCP